MTLTLNSNWIAAVKRHGAQLRLLLTVTFNDSSSYKALSGKCTNVVYPCDIVSVSQLSSKLNPLTREMQIGGISVTLRADRWRDIIVAKRIKLQQAVLEIGEASLTEADFEPFFSGFVDRATPSLDWQHLTLELLDVFQALQVKEIRGTWPNATRSYAPHPLQVLADINTLADIPAGLIDSTSLNPDTDTTRSHLVLARFAQIGAEIATNQPKGLAQEAVPALDMAAEVARLLSGSYIATEDGKLTFRSYSAAAASTFDWTQDQIRNLRPVESNAHLVNRVLMNWRYFSSTRRYNMQYERNDTDSQTNHKYPGETQRIVTHQIETGWMQQHCCALLTTITGGAAAPFDIDVAWNPLLLAGSREAIGTPAAAAQISADRPLYIRTGYPFEVLKVTAVSYNQNRVAELAYRDPDTDSELYAVNMPSVATLTVSARAQLDTSAAAHSAWSIAQQEAGQDLLLYDITLPVMLAQDILGRFGDGVEIVECETSFSEYATQVGDVGTITHADFMAYGKDGLTTSTKWEVVCKEPRYGGAEPCIRWVLASMPSTTPTTTHNFRHLTPYDALQALYDDAAGDDVIQKHIPNGLGITLTGSFGISIAAGAAKAGSFKSVLRVARTHNVPASKDTYVTMDVVTRSIGYHSVANGAAAPTLAPHEVLLGKVVSNGAGATSVDTTSVQSKAVKGSELLEGTGPLTKLSSAGLLDNITSVTARDISNMTDGTYARVLAAALSAGKVDLNAGTAGFANTLPTAQIADYAITAAKIGVNTWLAYRGTSNQTFTKKSLEKVQFNTEDWDEGADFDSATNYRWTNGDGQSFVHCEAQVTISTVENGSYAYIALRRNGTIVRQSEEYRNNSGVDRTNVRVSCDFGQIRCATTDYLEVFVFVDDSVDRDVVFGAAETWFSGSQVRRA